MDAFKSSKQPLDIDRAIDRIREAVRPYPKAAMFVLAEEGYRSPFEQLIACIISIRTYDEVSLPVCRHLFGQARNPAQVSELTPDEIDRLIRESTFHDRKAQQIHAPAARRRASFASQILAEHGGVLPCDLEILLSFSGVGPKCAHLTLGIACGQPYISVDTHVHRVTNRWGYVQTRTPEKTTAALEQKLPPAYWIEINQLLVPFGKHICTGQLPRCSTCPVLDMCQQVGVQNHR